MSGMATLPFLHDVYSHVWGRGVAQYVSSTNTQYSSGGSVQTTEWYVPCGGLFCTAMPFKLDVAPCNAGFSKAAGGAVVVICHDDSSSSWAEACIAMGGVQA
jgi:hypothetical protein